MSRMHATPQSVDMCAWGCSPMPHHLCGCSGDGQPCGRWTSCVKGALHVESLGQKKKGNKKKKTNRPTKKDAEKYKKSGSCSGLCLTLPAYSNPSWRHRHLSCYKAQTLTGLIFGARLRRRTGPLNTQFIAFHRKLRSELWASHSMGTKDRVRDIAMCLSCRGAQSRYTAQAFWQNFHIAFLDIILKSTIFDPSLSYSRCDACGTNFQQCWVWLGAFYGFGRVN